MKPGEYKKRILVAVSGLSPAILTETFYALAVGAEGKFIPTEIHLITTKEGMTRADNALLKGEAAAFKRLCEEYELDSVLFNADHIHVIHNADGEALSDIRDPLDNEAAADFIVNTIKSLTSDDDSAVHVSVAGGRKTMGYYVGYALSLFGRNQDRLSHVLVDEDYEYCPQFFYPTKKPVVEVNKLGKHVDFSEAQVYLAEIPFVRLRSHLPASAVKQDVLLKGDVSFSRTVNLAQLANEEPKLLIDVKNKKITANGYEADWGQSDIFLAFYVWVIEQNLDQGVQLVCPAVVEPNMDYGKSFLRIYEAITANNRDIEKTQLALKSGMDANFFNEKRSRVNKELQSCLGTALASLFEIKRLGKKGYSHYTVPFDDSVVSIKLPNQVLI